MPSKTTLCRRPSSSLRRRSSSPSSRSATRSVKRFVYATLVRATLCSLSPTHAGPGSVIAEYAFTPKPGSDSIVQPWLWLSPSSGLVLPRESETITATILIDSSTAAAFNLAEAEVSELAILRLVGGRDLFISVAAREYRRTCFGTPLDKLALLSRPIRSYAPADIEAAIAAPPPTSSAAVPVPATILRLTTWLTENAMETVRALLASRSS